MKLSPLPTLSVAYILGGAVAAGCVKYNVITNPTMLQVAKVASVALPVIGILVLLLAWVLSRRDRAATDETPPSAKQNLAPGPTGQGSEAPITPPEASSSEAPQSTQEPPAPPKHTGTGHNGAAVPPPPAPIRADSVSSMNSGESTNSSTDAATLPNSVTSDGSVLDAPPPTVTDLPDSGPKSGSLADLLAKRKGNQGEKSKQALNATTVHTALQVGLSKQRTSMRTDSGSLEDALPTNTGFETQVAQPQPPATKKVTTRTPPQSPSTTQISPVKKATEKKLNITAGQTSSAAAQAAARRAVTRPKGVGDRTSADLDAEYGNSADIDA